MRGDLSVNRRSYGRKSWEHTLNRWPKETPTSDVILQEGFQPGHFITGRLVIGFFLAQLSYHHLHALLGFHPILIWYIPAIFSPRQLLSRRLFRRTIFTQTLLEKCICSTSLCSTVFLRHTWLAGRYRQIFYMRYHSTTVTTLPARPGSCGCTNDVLCRGGPCEQLANHLAQPAEHSRSNFRQCVYMWTKWPDMDKATYIWQSDPFFRIKQVNLSARNDQRPYLHHTLAR